MTECFEKNLIALRHCLLYEFLQNKSVDDACSDLSAAFGKHIFNKEEVYSHFRQFNRGIFLDGSKPVTDMRKILRNDKKALRVCVMYEWLTTKSIRKNKALPVSDKYEDFCKVFGKYAMNYREFDFWFYRFVNGGINLNFVKNKGELTNMPLDIMSNIVEYLDIFDRMIEFFKNNPIAFRRCLLYEFLHKKPVVDAYSDFVCKLGPGVIEKEELEFWFNQFEQGNFDDNKKPIDNIVDILRNDKLALRICVLYESLTTESKRVQHAVLREEFVPTSTKSFAKYKNFCDLLGDDVMEYREFDFWLYRFVNGELDLNYERNMDKKIYELMDMPIDIMKYIVENLNIFDRTQLAKTSRSLQKFVEDQKLFHHTLKLVLDNNSITISFSASASILYTGNHESCIKSSGNKLKVFNGVSLWEKGLMDHYSIVEIPKLHLDTFSIDCSLYPSCGHNPLMYDEISEESDNSDEFSDYLNVKTLNLKVRFWHLLLPVLSSLKPGYLTTIDIDIDSYEPDEAVMDEVVEMEQWKQAKCLSMTCDFFRGPLHHLYHFKEFSILYRELSVMDVREMKEILFKSPEFEKCTIGISFENPIDVDAIRKEFGDAVQEKPHIYHYPISDTIEYFEIELISWRIKITRKKK